jgi:hypothetical protein
MRPRKRVEDQSRATRLIHQPTTTAISDHDEADEAKSSAEQIAAQLRRRRAASYRLPPLSSGRRDPWGAPSR